MVPRRGFQIWRGECFTVAGESLTLGGRVQETTEIVRERGGHVVGVGVIVDLSGGTPPNFEWPLVSLVALNVETFPADAIPSDLAAIPAIKPGSK